MNSHILVSLIVPVYNAEKCVETAILSVLCQKNNWLELVLVNDGSIDRSYEICKKYESDLVQCISTENMGAGHARNVGIENARGKWIGFLDSDDLVLSGFFDERMGEKLKSLYERKIDIIYTPKLECDYELSGKPTLTYPEDVDQIQYYMPNIEFWSCLYRIDFIRGKKIKFFEYKTQDVESAFRFRCFSNANKILSYREKVFYLHRDNPISNVNTWNLDNVLRIKTLVFCQLAIEFDKPEPEVKQWLLSQSIFSLKGLLFRCLKLGMLADEEIQLYEALNQVLEIYKSEFSYIKSKYKFIVFILCILHSNILLWHLFVILCKRRKKTEKNKITSVKKDDIEILLETLNNYNYEFNNRKEI